MSVINGKAYWAHVVSPNTTFDSDGVWSIDVCNLDKKAVDIIKKDGLSVKNDKDHPEKGDFISIRRNVRRKNGSLNRAPEVKDAQKRIMVNTLIGNGSEVNVLYSTYDWEYKGRSGRSADLMQIQVVDLIPYSTDNDEDFEEIPGGYASTEEDTVKFAS